VIITATEQNFAGFSRDSDVMADDLPRPYFVDSI
jgi:hypothetical protein